MTAQGRLQRLQRSLALAIFLRAACYGLCASLVVFAIAGMFARIVAVLLLAAVTGLAVAAITARKARLVRSISTVALWVEERTPALRYALVTIAEGKSAPALEAQATSTPWWTDAERSALKSLSVPAAVLGITVALFAWGPQNLVSFDFSSQIVTSRQTASNVDPIARVHVLVQPPLYAGKSTTESNDPTSVEALVGSRISLSGAGKAINITARVDSLAQPVAERGDGWTSSLIMPARPGIIRLHSFTGKDRLIVLAPIGDAAPAVTLLAPARDSILRRATGSILLHAQLRDDIGLRDAEFEMVISSGGGENFTFRSGRIGHVQLAGRTESSLDARLSFDSLALKPGDILQLRAVARDANNVNGPGIGSSETRSIRVARADEYDSVSVEQMPPPEAEGQTLSQRMLINLTEALVKKQAQLAHPMLVAEAQRIGREQRKLRKKVGDIVFQRLGAEPLSEEESGQQTEQGKLTPEQLLAMADSVTSSAGGVMDVEGDETPILAINKPLLEAFNAMWDAGRALDVGEPAKALPPMRIALAAIEKARTAERIYLRGRPGTTIVDVSKIRLSGKDKGTAALREPRVPADPVARRRSESFERVSLLLASNPEAAADSLLLMRVDALNDAPVLAKALDDAAKALRKRDNAEIPLAWQRVRRALGGTDTQHAGVAVWLGAP